MDEASEVCLQEKIHLQTEIDEYKKALRDTEDPSVPVPDSSIVSSLGTRVTKKGKRIQTLSDFQKEEELRKLIDERILKVGKLDKDIRLINKSLQNADQDISARVQAGWKQWSSDNQGKTREQYEVSSYCLSIREEVPLPKLIPPVEGIRVVHKCDHFLLQTDFAQLATFLDRHIAEPFWYAPAEALKEGKPTPLSHEAETFLIKNASNKKMKISSFDRGMKQKMAWRWLIISYNSMHPTTRVNLNPKLSVNYGRKLLGGKNPVKETQTLPPPSEVIAALKEEFRKIVAGPEPEKSTLNLEERKISISLANYHDFVGLTGSLLGALVGDSVSFDKGFFLPMGEDGKIIAGVLNRWGNLADQLEHNLPMPASPLVLEKPADKVPSKRGRSVDSVDLLEIHPKPRGRSNRPATPGPAPKEDDDKESIFLSSDLETCDICGTIMHRSVDDCPTCRDAGSNDVQTDYTCILCNASLTSLYQECKCIGDKRGDSGQRPTDSELGHLPEVDELPESPESFDEDGLTWFRSDIDFVDVHEGQKFLSQFKFGADYFAIFGPTSEKVKSEAAKGKTPVVPKPETSSGPSNTKSPKKEKKKATGKGDPKNPSSPIQEENPLKVKKDAKSSALSEDQRTVLRKHFGLTDKPVPPGEWAKMDKKAKQASTKARSLPRWATTAVLKRASALDDVLSGKLTKENVRSELGKLPQAGSSTGQALEAWTKLKSDFAGVTLFSNPSSSREKALKKRFDQLVLDYGEQRCFPKPRQNPDRQGRSRSAQRGSTSRSGMSDLIDMAKAMGEIARAFKS